MKRLTSVRITIGAVPSGHTLAVTVLTDESNGRRYLYLEGRCETRVIHLSGGVRDRQDEYQGEGPNDLKKSVGFIVSLHVITLGASREEGHDGHRDHDVEAGRMGRIAAVLGLIASDE